MSRRIAVYSDFEKAKRLMTYVVVLTWLVGFNTAMVFSLEVGYEWIVFSLMAAASIVWLWVVLGERDRLIQLHYWPMPKERKVSK